MADALHSRKKWKTSLIVKGMISTLVRFSWDFPLADLVRPLVNKEMYCQPSAKFHHNKLQQPYDDNKAILNWSDFLFCKLCLL